MTEEESKPSSNRTWIAGVGVAVIAVVAGVGSLLYFDEPTVDPIDNPVPPRPPPTVEPAPPRPVLAPGRSRVSMPPPDDRDRPIKPDNPTPAPVTPELRREMNYFVDDMMTAARDKCILPWMEEFDDGTTAEFVFDAVMYDGQMYDFGIRSLDHDLPESIQACIADEVWAQEAPTIELAGEVRLQRSATYRALTPSPE